MTTDVGTKCLSLAIIPMVILVLVMTQSKWFFQEIY